VGSGVNRKRENNRLFHGLIVISLVIHFFVFLHISGIYQSEAWSRIELALKDVYEPPTRDIPRPRDRSEPPKPQEEIQKLQFAKRVVPSIKPVKMDPVERDLPNSLVESVSMPEIPETPGMSLSDFDPATLASLSDYSTRNDYLGMVRLRIERHKKYPRLAKVRQIEGRTKVRFVIDPHGRVTDVAVVKGSRHQTLDEAALEAIKMASPFPRPPRHLFEGPISLEITIVFELT
jgi:protein TonB